MACIFEVAVHNERVRKLRSEGAHDQALSDIWSHTNYLFVAAEDEHDAVEKVMLRLPEDTDFVVDSIRPHNDYMWGQSDR